MVSVRLSVQPWDRVLCYTIALVPSDRQRRRHVVCGAQPLPVPARPFRTTHRKNPSAPFSRSSSKHTVACYMNLPQQATHMAHHVLVPLATRHVSVSVCHQNMHWSMRPTCPSHLVDNQDRAHSSAALVALDLQLSHAKLWALV